MSGMVSGMMSGEFMFEMAWKSALIAGVALLLVFTLRSRAAADRSAVLRVSVALLLALPLVSLSLPRFEVEAWTPAPIEVPAAAIATAALPDAAGLAPELAAAQAKPTIWDDPTILFLLLYLGGVAMAAARLGAGLWTLRRWTREAEDVDCPLWAEAFERCRRNAGAPANLRLRLADEVPSPLSWGLIRPVILVDRETVYRIEDADAILAHEIAHVVRRDWAVLMLARIAVGLFWFNPLVRMVEREMVQHAEEAADIEAARRVEPALYAQTLVHWAQFHAAGVPAHSIAPGARALARRVRAILDARRRTTPSGSPWSLAAMAGTACFALALAVLQPIAAAAEIRPIAAIAPPAPVAPVAASAPLAPQAPHAALAPASPPAPLAAATPATPAAPATPPAPPSAKFDGVGPIGPVGPVHVAVPYVDEAAIERQVALALASVDGHRIAADAARAARHGMATGAAGLEQNARRMELEARLLGSRAYRERRIAEAAGRGQQLGHDDLIEMARGLREGARGMHEGAREMRRSAAELGRDGHD